MEDIKKTEIKEDKLIHIENVGKGIYTTVIGSILLGVATTAVIMNWFFPSLLHEPIPYIPVSIVGTVGFALLFMRDKVSSYIDIFAKKRLDKQ